MSSLSLDYSNFCVHAVYFRGISIVLLWQTLYPPHAQARMISQTVQYFILLRSMRIRSQVRQFAGQLGLGRSLMDAYQMATATQYSYLLVDNHPMTPGKTTHVNSHNAV